LAEASQKSQGEEGVRAEKLTAMTFGRNAAGQNSATASNVTASRNLGRGRIKRPWEEEKKRKNKHLLGPKKEKKWGTINRKQYVLAYQKRDEEK